MDQRHDLDDLVVRLVNTLLTNAAAQGASDIHIEPQRHRMRVRYRVDGLLVEQEPIEAGLTPQVVSRIKVLSRINIVQRKIPQDGKFCFTHNNNAIDVRVSTFPCVYGETVVLRLLDRTDQLLSLSHLGFTPAMYDAFTGMLAQQHGLLLVTGPTGSGKTTTLYAALSHINGHEKNIITLEDPVEYSIDGITQGHIDNDVGFTFEKGIRAMLRQDPDILLVGEIRDRQTARVAIEAALTGHLVLSTLHTNDAPSAIMRLMDMGVEPFLINAVLIGVLAQRLVRTICSSCRTEFPVTTEDMQILHSDMPLQIMYKGNGCSSCNSFGYKGRVGIFELLPITQEMRSLIGSQPSIDALYAQAYQDGMKPLKYDAATKVHNGITSLQEFVRVVL